MFLNKFRVIRRGGPSAAPPAERSYWAFISYSHADEAWAKWLHGELERYRVPRPLVGRTTAKGAVPRRLLPIFRDRDELPGSPSLASEIGEALARSRSLIVICSPKAAVSRYVNHEIVSFKRRGRGEDILCLLVDGEPNATDTPEAGLLEAMPAPVRFNVDADGAITADRAEPLAADVRPGKDTRVDAKLKIVAGMLGVGFDELKRREARRRLHQRLQIAAASLAIVTVVAGVWWNRQRALEEQRRIALARQLATQSAEYASQRPDLSSLLALASLDASDTPEARDALFAVAARVNHATTTIRDPSGKLAITTRFSPDGRTLVVGTTDGRLSFWDAATARQLAEKKGHDGNVTAVVFSPDQQTFASGSSDGTVVLWDPQRFSTKAVLNPAAGQVLDLAFSADGTTVRSVSERASILWRVADGARLGLIPVEDVSNNRVIVSPDGTRVGVAGDSLQVWDAEADRIVAAMKPPPSRYIQAFAFSRSERTVTTVDSAGTIVKWNIDTGQKAREGSPSQRFAKNVKRIAVSADGKVVAIYAGDITVMDVERGTSVTMPVARVDGTCLAMTDDGRKVAWCGGDGTVAIWDTRAQPLRTSLTSSHLKVAGGVAFSPDGTTLASGDTEGRVILWGLDGRVTILQGTSGFVVGSLAFGGNNLLATAARHGYVTVWDTSKPEHSFTLGEPAGILGADVAFSSDGTRLASSINETITLWDTTSWQPKARLQNDSTARKIAFNRQDTVLAAANSNGTVSLWNASTHNRIATLNAHREEVMGLAFSPDGKRLASAGRDGTVVVWDMDSRAQARRFDALDEIYSIAFSPDNKTLAHGSDNGRLILRDVETFRQLVAIREHRTAVKDVVFSADGHNLASTDGQSIIVWHDFNLAAWRERACMSAGRNMTNDEWRLFVGNGEYRALCPAYPVSSPSTSPASTRR